MENKKSTIDHNAILDVPKKFWTHELCLATVKRDYTAIHYMTEDYFTKELCLAAFQQGSKLFDMCQKV